MSGARLCSLLGELGFQGAEGLDPDSFEWPFQYEDARPILDWICSSLRPSNVFSLSELSQLRSSLCLSLRHLILPSVFGELCTTYTNFLFPIMKIVWGLVDVSE